MSIFIVFAEDWQRHPSSSQHLMQQLGKQHKVIWVNSIGLRSPRFSFSDVKRLWQKGLALFSAKTVKANEPTEQFGTTPQAIISPCCLPLHQFAVVRWLNRHLLRIQITGQLRLLQTSTPEPVVLWLALPSAVCIVGAFSEQLVVYYCGDDFASLAGVDHDVMTKLEQSLAASADIIFCASTKLTDKFSDYLRYQVSHGVDLALFSAVYPRPAALPNGRPIAGFYGLLADWLDVELLSTVARSCPDWHFVLIGRLQTDISALQSCKNVQFISEMPHSQLAHFASHFQALLLPFKQCQQIEFCNPLKLREYLALGQPILTVPFPALAPYSAHVMQMHQAADWVNALQNIATWSEQTRLQWQQKARRAVSADSWQARAKQIEACIDASLCSKHTVHLCADKTGLEGS